MAVTAPKHEPLWAIGLSALLIAFGFARDETGPGRSAETPSEIPAPGWKDILFRVCRGISENRVLLVAAGVTFYALLANFPGIAALISIYGLFADPASVANHLDAIANVTRVGRSTDLDIGQRELLDIGQRELLDIGQCKLLDIG